MMDIVAAITAEGIITGIMAAITTEMARIGAGKQKF
jgi:hypothetical protein